MIPGRPFHDRPCVDDVRNLTGMRVNPDHVMPAVQVRPDTSSYVGKIVYCRHWIAITVHRHRTQRLQGTRITKDQFTAAITGQHIATRAAYSPTIAIKGNHFRKLHGCRVPAQGNSLTPCQLPDGPADTADTFTKQLRQQWYVFLRLLCAQLIAPQ
jgi:hypothetical protein